MVLTGLTVRTCGRLAYPFGTILGGVRCILAASLLGGATVGATYAAARAAGLTRTDLATRLAPGHPRLGRLGQLAIGSAGCLPCALAGRPSRGAALGAAFGLASGLPRRDRRELGVSVAAHALGGAVATLRPRRRACP
jgi:hypothetical protein